MNPIEFRSAVVSEVSFPHRTIDLVVMPYESETMIEFGGRLIREVVSRGAFNGIEGRANRVKVNRDHDITKVVGRAVAFHPGAEQGLVAECRIAQTPLGDETLQLADEEILDASAGFAPMEQRWEERSLRRIVKAFLSHIALVPEAAYAGARVLDVRTRPEDPVGPLVAADTPNLDRVRAWRLQAAYDALGR
jgi:HK97 family phage prohead protease